LRQNALRPHVTDWDARRYHKVSEPQFDWKQRIIARLQPAAGERILDVRCGTGRLTREILEAAGARPDARVIGLDRSGSMLAVARAEAAVSESPIGYVQGDGTALPFANAFDAIFSAATFHWIHDHPAVFRSVRTALVPGGRFVAQCGGKGNLQHMLEYWRLNVGARKAAA
jgi:trans-aconitate 2-methyltransferase